MKSLVYLRARVCACACACVCVKAYLQNDESQRHQILLAHAEPINVDIESVTVFQSSLGTTQFLADRSRLHTIANFSRKSAIDLHYANLKY